MSKIKVRLVKRGTVNVKLKPKNGIKAKTDTTYLYDPTLVAGWVDLAEDWAIKTDGKVEEEGVEIDYSAKAYAIGGTGTQTNNAKYYAEQASNSATSASNSATTATTQAGIATTQAGIATTKAGEAATSATNASNYATSAAGSANDASHSAGDAYSSEINAASSASTATTQAGIATTKAGEASGYATSASNSALSASTSATNSQIWAEGTDVQVSALGGEKSSKGWAIRAKEIVDSIGTVLHYKGSVATYADLPTTGQVVGDMWNVLADGANYAWDGTGWDALSGIVDLTGYATQTWVQNQGYTKVTIRRL